jgi:integrase
MGSVYRQHGRTNWTIKYYREGRPIIESTGTDDKRKASKILRERETDLDRGVPISAAIGKVRWEEAVKDLRIDYQNNDQSSWDDVERRIALHLTPVFRGRRLATITPGDIRDYTNQRKNDTYVPGRRVSRDGVVLAKGNERHRRAYSNAQINRELTTLKRMFNLARELGKLAYVPYIPLLTENNVRKGFFGVEEFRAVRAHLPHPINAIATFAYLTGWRIDSEVLPLEWQHVDFDAGEVRIWVGDDKNDAGRVFVMTDELRALLQAQHAEHERLQRAGHITPWVFVRMVAKGRRGPKSPRRVLSIYKAWKAACSAAGLPGRIPHDFRRSAARNMVRAGVPERVAMKLTGHKTRSIFERYNIVSDGDLASAAIKLSGQLREHGRRSEKIGD